MTIQKTKKLPLGYDVFSEIAQQKLSYIDKSLFIKEILDDIAAKVILITRPRRFGKTFNLTMLQHFLAPEVQGKTTRGLFDKLKIAQAGKQYLEHQGKYPVIFITFKGVKDHKFKNAYDGLCKLLSDVYREHDYLLHSTKLSDGDKKLFTAILNREAKEIEIRDSLKSLSRYLFDHCGIAPWLLIDEYDTPIQSSYMHGYYDEMVNLMRYMFGEALKTNPYLYKGVITGILRIAKESLFSGLNNLKVCSLLNSEYSQHFGFTEEEMADLLKQYGLANKAKEIRDWYNGYQFGGGTVYNPWSIASCINSGGEIAPYWVNTSDNALIKSLLMRADANIKVQFESLLQKKPIEALIDENMVFGELDTNKDAIWNLLLFSGYLKAVSAVREGIKIKCQLLPPNQEVFALYQDTIVSWFTDAIGRHGYQNFLSALLVGNVEDFLAMLQKFLHESISMFDVKGNQPEIFYHGLVMGLLVSLEKTHIVKSNRESGFGRYDVMIIPKDPAKLGIILEFKTAKQNETLNAAAKTALKQIIDRNYAAELRQHGVSQILLMGLAFAGKEVMAECEQAGALI
jgi:hypothetical protein